MNTQVVPTRKTILMMADHGDPILREAFYGFHTGDWTYEQAASLAIWLLVNQNKDLQEELVYEKSRKPFVGVVPIA